MKATPNPTTLAMRQYFIELTVAMIVYLIVLFGTRWLFRGVTGPLEVVVALAPLIPVIFVFLAGLKLVRNTDEFSRQIMVESLAIAGALTALLSVTYGFLEIDILPRPSAWWVWSTFMLLWAFSSLVLRRRYQ